MGVLLKYEGSHCRIVIWKIGENVEELSDLVTRDDVESVSGLVSESRKTGRLAARAAFRQVMPEAVVRYDENGAPFLPGRPEHVSFSHCRGAAAAIVSDRRCAIDIEDAGRNFDRAAARFVSAKEGKAIGNESPLFLPAVWCSKEALYKYAGRPGTDFLRDMEVSTFDPDAGSVRAMLWKQTAIDIAVGTVENFIFCHIPG